MTIPDALRRPRLAVCLSDAAFSCRVLSELRARERLPALVLLPEFPPAVPPASIELADSSPRAILQLIGDLPLLYAAGAGEAQLASALRRARIEYLLVACWPRLLGPRMRAAATRATLNLHPSCLPRFRGADPIGEQLAAGEERLGVTLHLLDERFDHGDIVAQASFAIAKGERNRAAIEREAAGRGVDLLLEAMHLGPEGWRPRSQDQAFVTD
ncbi:MAG: formyltransferase family protein [Gammaproteobacteria bacterium]|nr:formyltransferase family protein [Gammaproteobacteria bacterium]